ncbi:hypothetical protein E2C01_099858 [Portunus trituberculatus]|uniref:Uncharacterized protein n=1 Tax=Portunus trituberculatus TaxID=210409 RepID=A0A5B7KBT7_PORTR|nr:hypothetical protein [Portunus trituberculatus]
MGVFGRSHQASNTRLTGSITSSSVTAAVAGHTDRSPFVASRLTVLCCAVLRPPQHNNATRLLDL